MSEIIDKLVVEITPTTKQYEKILTAMTTILCELERRKTKSFDNAYDKWDTDKVVNYRAFGELLAYETAIAIIKEKLSDIAEEVENE